jgi:hypothetical protein
MADELKMVAETEGILWSVRANGTVFLIVHNKLSGFDVHTVADGGVEYLGDVETHSAAVALIQGSIGS